MTRESRKQLIEELVAAARASQSGTDAMDQASADRLGINRTDLACLDVIERSGPLTAGELAEAMRLTTGAVTAVLDRLERAGYARRVRDTTDRRRVLVEIDPKLYEDTEEIWGELGKTGRAMLERYSTDELRLIRDFLQLSMELNLEHAARVRALGEKKPGG